MSEPDPFYITTPIYYVNATPHLGTFYTTVAADALARYRRARQGAENTYFLTGTDEHGQKMEQIARQHGVAPKEYTDRIVAEFKATWARAGIDLESPHTRFIRTTDADHAVTVREIWERMRAAGDLYLAEYDGLYCVGCEDYKTDAELLTRGEAKLCPIHQRPVERVQESNYFFRLSRYQTPLLELYERDPGFIRPESRRNEVTEFVKGGLRDLSVSRTSVKWGIPVPDAPGHVVYVWVDALANYVTALGGARAVQSGGPLERVWRSCVHLIAKDILRFHAVYWPAFLMSAGLPLPRGVFCHGYWTVKGQKVSKSIPATHIDPGAIGGAIGFDPLRYFVLREVPLGADGDFSYESLFRRHESDLGNDLGNLLNRTVSMAQRFAAGQVPAFEPAGDALWELAEQQRAASEQLWDAFAPSRALEATWELIRAANTDIDRVKPWELAKDPARAAELGRALARWCEVLLRAALLVAPAMPDRSREILRQLGAERLVGSWPAPAALWAGGSVGPPEPVFPRIDKDRRAAWIAEWTSGKTGAEAKD